MKKVLTSSCIHCIIMMRDEKEDTMNMKRLLEKISDKMGIINFIYSDAKDMDLEDLKDLKDLISEAIKDKEVAA